MQPSNAVDVAEGDYCRLTIEGCVVFSGPRK